MPQRDDQGPKSATPAGTPVGTGSRLPEVPGQQDDFPRDAADLFDAIIVDDAPRPLHVPTARPPTAPSAGPVLPPSPTTADVDVDIDDIDDGGDGDDTDIKRTDHAGDDADEDDVDVDTDTDSDEIVVTPAPATVKPKPPTARTTTGPTPVLPSPVLGAPLAPGSAAPSKPALSAAALAGRAEAAEPAARSGASMPSRTPPPAASKTIPIDLDPEMFPVARTPAKPPPSRRSVPERRPITEPSPAAAPVASPSSPAGSAPTPDSEPRRPVTEPARERPAFAPPGASAAGGSRPGVADSRVPRVAPPPGMRLAAPGAPAPVPVLSNRSSGTGPSPAAASSPVLKDRPVTAPEPTQDPTLARTFHGPGHPGEPGRSGPSPAATPRVPTPSGPLTRHSSTPGVTAENPFLRYAQAQIQTWETELATQPDLFRAARLNYEIARLLEYPLADLNPAERADSPNRQFRYCIRLHRAGRQLMTWYGDRTGTVLFNSDVHIPAIYQCLPDQPGVWNETPWMSLTPAELMTLREGSRLAKGRVVIAGLGLGHQLIEVSKRLQVREIVLVELSQELLDFYLPRVRPLVKKRLTVLVGDAFEIVPTLRADVALIDIFPAYGGNEAATRALSQRSPHIRKMWGWGTATLHR